MLLDLIILGAGPAGITAAIYASRKNMKFIVISKDVGGQTLWSADIENYTGYQIITGPDLIGKFREHLEKINADIKEQEEVKEIKKEKDIIVITSDKGEYRAKTLIIATGRVPRQLDVKGEDKFLRMGV